MEIRTGFGAYCRRFALCFPRIVCPKRAGKASGAFGRRMSDSAAVRGGGAREGARAWGVRGRTRGRAPSMAPHNQSAAVASRHGAMAGAHGNGARSVRTATGHERGRAPRRWRGGAMGTSRPTAITPAKFARARGVATGHGGSARQRGAAGACGRGARAGAGANYGR